MESRVPGPGRLDVVGGGGRRARGAEDESPGADPDATVNVTGVSWRLKSGEIRWLSTLDGRIIMPFRKDYSSVDSVDQPVLLNPDKTDLQAPSGSRPPPGPSTGAASARLVPSLLLPLAPAPSVAPRPRGGGDVR